MAVLGPGGTGKTVVIRAIQEFFRHWKQSHTLRLCAYMGQPAHAIEGRTLCSLLGMKSHDDAAATHKSPTIQRQDEWKDVEWLIVDEVSLVGLRMLHDIHQSLHQLKGRSASLPFGGLNIICFGDFYQFSPIAGTALWRTGPTKDIKVLAGQNLWSQFDFVVELHEQKRQVDSRFGDFLLRLRDGKCHQTDVHYLNQRLLARLPAIERASFRDAQVIVTRTVVRNPMNLRYARRISHLTGHPLVISVAMDAAAGRSPVPLPEKLRRRLLRIPEKKSVRSPAYVALVIGMAVMLKFNVATELGLYNGAEGMVVDIVYSPNDMERVLAYKRSGSTAGIRLTAQPLYALVYFPKCKADFTVQGFPPGVVPIFPEKVQCSFTATRKYPLLPGTTSKTWQRTQLPLQPAHAMSDYSSQGRTMDRAVIDCAQVPGDMGSLGAQNTYVALSRLRTLAGLALLRPLTPADLKRSWPDGLTDAMERLHILAAKSRLRLDNILRDNGVQPLPVVSSHAGHADHCLCSSCALVVANRPPPAVVPPSVRRAAAEDRKKKAAATKAAAVKVKSKKKVAKAKSEGKVSVTQGGKRKRVEDKGTLFTGTWFYHS